MKKYIITLFLITHIFAFGGLGFYGGSNNHSTTAAESTSGVVTITPGPLNNSLGLGFFVYLDVVPVVDLEAAWELAGNTYPFQIDISGEKQNYDFTWGRVSSYYTIRKKIVGAGIPFLAKAQLYGGLGFNMHTITSDITVSSIENAFLGMNLEAAADQDFSDDVIVDQLIDYMDDHNRTATGFHLQVGGQAKLLILNLFINARYTIAKDVIPGTSGFPTIWTGIAIGL